MTSRLMRSGANRESGRFAAPIELEDLRHRLPSQRPIQNITLDRIASLGAQKRQLLRRFYSFSHYFESHAMRHCDDGASDLLVVGVRRNVLDERAIDLQRVDREALEVGQR